MEHEESQESAAASRRALLKGAVGAGVAVAAYSAPIVSVVPAYGLTNSKVTNKCFTLQWSAPQNRWKNGNADTFAETGTKNTGPIGTYTWTNLTNAGGTLVIRVTGNVEDPTGNADGGTTNNPAGAPAVIEVITNTVGGTLTPKTTVPRTAGCVNCVDTSGSALSGSYSATEASGFHKDTKSWMCFDLL